MTNEEIIKRTMRDLQPLSCTKDEYLAVLAKIRLEESTLEYDKRVDRLINDLLVNIEFSQEDIKKNLNSLVTISKSVNKLYSSLLKQFKYYQNLLK